MPELDQASINLLRDMAAWWKANKANVNRPDRARPRLMATGQKIFFGVVKETWTGPGTTIELAPCNSLGEETGEANVTVYLYWGSTVNFEAVTTGIANRITAYTIIPYELRSDGNYYALGYMTEIVANVGVVVIGDTKHLIKHPQYVWTLFRTDHGGGWIDCGAVD